MNKLGKMAIVGAVATGLATPVLADDIDLKMATIAPGTSPYLTMTTMATIVNQDLDDVNISVDATGAATKHMIEVAQGKLDMAMTSPTVYDFMKHGKFMYSELPNAAEMAEQLKLVMWFPLGQYHFVTHADSGINSPADFAGKKIFLGPPGGGAYVAASRTVKFMTGMEPEKDFEPVNASWSSAAQGFQDRQFDVMTSVGISPFPLLEQMALTSELKIIGLTKQEFEANEAFVNFIETTDGEEIGIIPQDAYGDNVVNKEDVYTLAATVGVTARADLDEDLVYRITKSFWEGMEGEMETHPWLGDITKEIAVSAQGMQLHPGALKFYEEIGLEIPEGSR